MRYQITGIYKIKGVGNVVMGFLLEGTIKNNQKVSFLIKNTKTIRCSGITKFYRCEETNNINTIGKSSCIVIKDLFSDNKPDIGDIMIPFDK